MQLDSERVVETLERLSRRIQERFPEAHLIEVSQNLVGLARRSARESAAMRRPNWSLRLLVTALFAALPLAVFLVPRGDIASGINSLADLVQTLEAGLGSIVFLSAAIFFVVTLETRLKRTRALGIMHQLRSIAHIVDMHQLTKDPEAILRKGSETASSPERTLTKFELGRYLDYCGEMLSLIGKVASLHVEGFADPTVLRAVNEIENLTTGLSRKIWQKIMILERTREVSETLR